MISDWLIPDIESMVERASRSNPYDQRMASIITAARLAAENRAFDIIELKFSSKDGVRTIELSLSPGQGEK